jgi:hypothetical protein
MYEDLFSKKDQKQKKQRPLSRCTSAKMRTEISVVSNEGSLCERDGNREWMKERVRAIKRPQSCKITVRRPNLKTSVHEC